MTGVPVSAVHIVIRYQAVCHSCGWEAEERLLLAIAEHEADAHQCEAVAGVR